MFSIISLMGAMAALGGSVGYFVFPTGLSFGLKMFINLAENGMVFPLYMNPPIGPVSTYYLYAIRNPRDVLQGKKPSFALKGPYKFNVKLVKEQIKFQKDGEQLSFDSSRQLAWDYENSANPDEKMWLINPILPATAKTVRAMIIDRIPFKRFSEPVVFNTVNLLLDNYKERLFMLTTPRQIMDGRKIKMLDDITRLASSFGASSLLPPGPPQNIFGLVYVQNRTIDSIEIYSGVGKTRARYAEVIKFRNKDRLDVWKGKCNTIIGTNGELYKPFVDPTKAQRIFLGPLCRSTALEPVSDQLVRTDSGVMAYELELSPRLFLGARNNPDNRCYCPDTRTYDCQYDGLITMGPCFFDSPLYFAHVNFKGTDPRISQLIDITQAQRLNNSEPGWQLPDKQTFRLDHMTGTVLEVDLSLFALFKVVRQAYMRDLAGVQRLSYMPLFVTNEQIKLPFSMVWQLFYLQKLNDYHKPIMAGMAASGLGVMVLKFLFG